MPTDLNLFSKITNRLIYLTTRDEYGSSRSKGIETLEDLTDELNDIGIVPSRGYWTETSLKLFFFRIRHRYTAEEMAEECDFEFLGRQSWEYLSHTKAEEVCENRSAKPNSHWMTPSEPYALDTYAHSDEQSWKPHEVDEIVAHDKKMSKILDSMKRNRMFAH